jgi:predicted house-cleaning noncanonical NTP pyrophosphatase (MazG superfamily)
MSFGGVSAFEAGPDAGGTELPPDDIFDILSNPRRRCVLHYLKQHDGRVELRDLVEHVAAWENDTTVEQLDSDERKRVYTALRQSHLDRMEDVGILEYDNDRGHIELTENAREVELYLERVPQRDIPWSEYYLGLSAVGAALIAATWFGAFPFAELSGLALAAILIGVFAVSAAVHTYQSAKNRIGSNTYEIEE